METDDNYLSRRYLGFNANCQRSVIEFDEVDIEEQEAIFWECFEIGQGQARGDLARFRKHKQILYSNIN